MPAPCLYGTCWRPTAASAPPGQDRSWRLPASAKAQPSASSRWYTSSDCSPPLTGGCVTDALVPAASCPVCSLPYRAELEELLSQGMSFAAALRLGDRQPPV